MYFPSVELEGAISDVRSGERCNQWCISIALTGAPREIEKQWDSANIPACIQLRACRIRLALLATKLNAMDKTEHQRDEELG